MKTTNIQRRRTQAHLVDAITYAVIAVLALCAAAAFGQEPQFQLYNPPGAVNDQGILQDVTSRLSPTRRQQSYEADPIGWAHEGTHYLNVQLDDWVGPDGQGKEEHAAYVGGGRFVVMRHPRVTLETVRTYVSPQLQVAFDSALCGWRQYNTEPLYLIDEWTAYANGSQACRELGADSSRMRGSDERAQWLGHFADALVAAVRAYDPGYPQLAELVAFVTWHRSRVAQLVGVAAIAQVGVVGQPAQQCRWQWDGGQWIKICETRPQQPVAPPPVTAAEVERADARGWSSAGSPPVEASPYRVVMPPLIAVPTTGIVYPAGWHANRERDLVELQRGLINVDRTAADRADALQRAIATNNEKLSLALGNVPVTVKAAIDADRGHLAGVLEKLPAATQTAVREGLKGLGETVAVRHVDSRSYVELLAQIVLVASGSGAVVYGGWGAWRIGAWLFGKALRAAISRHLGQSADLSDRTAPPARRKSRPQDEQTYVFDRKTQQAVAVDSPPIVEHAPPVTHYVSVENNRFAQAYQWAAEQVARKTNSTEQLSLLDSLIKQQLAGRKE
jgi:hypothetical protein